MSLIRPLKLPKLVLKNHVILYNVIRNHWNKDYKPGNIPTTTEEHAAAAKKYELFPEEYQPYPDDGNGIGDYPKLPMISAEAKDPFYPWDFPELKRNFNEPMHAEADLMGEDRYNVSARLRYPIWLLYAQFFGFMGVTFGIYYFAEDMKSFLAVAEKQYPKSGEPHYTFELKE